MVFNSQLLDQQLVCDEVDGAATKRPFVCGMQACLRQPLPNLASVLIRRRQLERCARRATSSSRLVCLQKSLHSLHAKRLQAQQFADAAECYSED